MNNPKISVIIPAWNASKTIGETLDSISMQTRKPDQVIVVDDGSSDQTAAIVRAHPVNCMLLQQENYGPARAINFGIENAIGDFIAIIDSDDLWTPNWLSAAEQSLIQHDVDMVFGTMETFLDAGLTDHDLRNFSYQKNAEIAFLYGACLIKSSVMKQLNGFDDSFKAGYFIEFFSRFKTAGYQYESVKNQGLLRRIRTNSLSFTMSSKLIGDTKNSALASGFLRVAHFAIKAKKSSGG